MLFNVDHLGEIEVQVEEFRVNHLMHLMLELMRSFVTTNLIDELVALLFHFTNEFSYVIFGLMTKVSKHASQFFLYLFQWLISFFLTF